jgi:protein pelota
MKQLASDFKKGFVKLQIENADDLWYLSQIIDAGDLVSGKTLRKIQKGNADEKTKAIRKPVFLKIRTEKIDFSESQTQLRILGLIEQAPEDIPLGEHHTFNIEANTEITIEKQKWYSFQKDKLKESLNSVSSKILLVAFDREEAIFAIMKKDSFSVISKIKGDVAKKDIETKNTSNFYLEIINILKEQDKKLSLDKIILGSPAFWKDELMKNLTDSNLKKKIITATCSSVGKSGINELLKRPEVNKALSDDRLTKEISYVETLINEISNEGKAVYGLKETGQAINSGAVESLLLTDSLIQEFRSEEKFEKLDSLMKAADDLKAKIHIISSNNEAGKKLAGLGGIAALLRYKLNY